MWKIFERSKISGRSKTGTTTKKEETMEKEQMVTLKEQIAKLEGYETRVANIDSPPSLFTHSIWSGVSAHTTTALQFKEGDLLIRHKDVPTNLGAPQWKHCPTWWEDPNWVLSTIDKLVKTRSTFSLLGVPGNITAMFWGDARLVIASPQPTIGLAVAHAWVESNK